jgi:hypothetical protein
MRLSEGQAMKPERKAEAKMIWLLDIDKEIVFNLKFKIVLLLSDK